MRIAELMTTDVKTCRRTDRLDRVAQLMWEHDIGALPIVDERDTVIGMITDRDVCIAAYRERRPLHDIPVEVAMTKHVVTCTDDDTDVDVARLMAKHKIRRIPVVDDAQHPIGMVSLDDLALAMARGREIPADEIAGTLAVICAHGSAM